MAKDKEAPRKLSRKDFVKGAAAVAGAGALSSCAPAGAPSPEVIKETVEVPVEVIKEVEVKPWLPEKWDYEADVVVVGIGFAGQAAAIEAADAGASVLVLEKSPRKHAGGNSFANFQWSFAFIGVDPEDSIEYVTSQCWGSVADPEVIRAIVETEFELPAWHESYGATVEWGHSNSNFPTILNGDKMGTGEVLNDFEAFSPEEWSLRYPGGSGKSPWQEWMMEEVLPGKGINVMCDTPAIELIQDGATKEILGVKALAGVTTTEDYHYTGGEEIYIKAKKGVVLACGGYENNHEMLGNFAPHPHSSVPPSGYLTFYGTPYNSGDGLTMATKVGAKLWHLNKKETHNCSTVVGAKELHHGIEVKAWANKIAMGPGVIVNRFGKRFFNEYHYGGHCDNTRPWDYMDHKVTPLDDYDYTDYPNVPYYWVFDDTTMKAEPLGYPKGKTSKFAAVAGTWMWSEDNEEELAKGWFLKADTIEELGNMIECKDFFGRVVGMDAAGLVETVNKYNQYCSAGEDLDFGRNPTALEPIVTPPFYIMEICELQTNTQGGPKHNKDCQTLDAYDEPIPRLYSCGEFGSIFGHLYSGGQNIPEAAAGGLLAARHAVTLEPWDA